MIFFKFIYFFVHNKSFCCLFCRQGIEPVEVSLWGSHSYSGATHGFYLINVNQKLIWLAVKEKILFRILPETFMIDNSPVQNLHSSKISKLFNKIYLQKICINYNHRRTEPSIYYYPKSIKNKFDSLCP